MEKYIEQLLADISVATENVSFPFPDGDWSINDWIPDEEENKTAPVRNLQDWTGVFKEQLPPVEKFNEIQLSQLLTALKKMLDVYNCSVVFQTEVPERIQYTAIRENFDQEVKVKRWHQGFFELCKEGTEHKKCVLGECCQCAFYAELFSGFVDEELSPEKERARELEIEVDHLKRKHGDDWMKYYPYHLDAKYDDENGESYNYGFENDDEDEKDDWWRK